MDATLLIADAQPTSREALGRFFTGCGFRMETAGDGLECLNKVKSLKPDVLVADLDAPWGGAAAVVAFLQESCFDCEMPAVLVIGNAAPQVLSERTGVPQSSCFEKPLRMERLLDRVGLAIALIDLRRDGKTPAKSRRRRRPAFGGRGAPGRSPAWDGPSSGKRHPAYKQRFQ